MEEKKIQPILQNSDTAARGKRTIGGPISPESEARTWAVSLTREAEGEAPRSTLCAGAITGAFDVGLVCQL